jgi:orotate phosphoribosyltransferase
MISGFKDLGINCDKVAGMELGAVALIVAYSLKTDMPFLIIRKGGREHGTKRKIEGDIKPGEKILLLEDVVTSGGSVIQAIDIVEEAGGEVVAVLTVVDREEGGTDKVMDRAKFIPLVRAKELLELADRM